MTSFLYCFSSITAIHIRFQWGIHDHDFDSSIYIHLDLDLRLDFDLDWFAEYDLSFDLDHDCKSSLPRMLSKVSGQLRKVLSKLLADRLI